jgi:diguanylate cyclase (GGDEF)-like protein/putative nucleotidyltransferase with HDIG domain
MPMEDLRIDDLRTQALAAADGLFEGETALAEVLRDIGQEKDRAAEAYRAVVRSLAAAIEARDGYTGDHSDEVQRLAVAVARKLGLDRAHVEETRTVALLHDIGKIGMPDKILHKTTGLDETEWELMRQHPVVGERILRPLPGLSGVATAVRHEHERWDGGGYPDGLAGDAIPLASRVVLACDAWHALRSDRPYRRALPFDDALAELRRCAGAQFDPKVVDALVACAQAPLSADDEPAPVAEPVGDSRLEAELKALVTVAAAVAAAHALDDVIEIAAEEARRALGADAFAISRLEDDGTRLRTLINVGELAGWEERRPADEVYELAEYPRLVAMFGQGLPHLSAVDDPDSDAAERALLHSLGKSSAVAVPVVFAGRPWGELYATRAAGHRAFADQDVRFMRTISGQVGGAIGRAELFSGIAELAFKDSLTGLANRRALDERLEGAVATAVESGRDLTVALCDLDNLKDINDGLGHEAGDEALTRTARVLEEAVADVPGSLVARIGGDEFCLLVDGLSAHEARTVIEGAMVGLAESGEPRLTLSCGIASLGGGSRRPADLVRAADSAQYTAKRTGRRRVCVAREQAGAQSPSAQRRSLRDRETARPQLLDEVLTRLDQPEARALDATRRLDLVVQRSARALRAPAWALSFAPEGASHLRTVEWVDNRSDGIRIEVDTGSSFELSDYPLTRRILADGGAFVVVAEDAEADSAERELLEGWSMTAVLAAAIPAPGGAWLAEIYADDATVDLHGAVAHVRLLVAEAVRGAAYHRQPWPSPSHPTSARTWQETPSSAGSPSSSSAASA